MKDFLNKDAIINIAFSGYGVAGYGSLDVYGQITSIENDMISISYDPNRKENRHRMKNTSGKMLINKQYLVSVTLL